MLWLKTEYRSWIEVDAKFRTSYDLIIKNILEVLPREKLLILIFENLNKKSFFNEIKNFLNITEDKKYVSEKINNSTEDLLTNINLKKEIVSNFKTTYLFCKKHFPETKNLWEGYKYLDD